MDTKKELKIYDTIYKMLCFPSFNVYSFPGGIPRLFRMNDSIAFARWLWINIENYPEKSLEEMIISAARMAFFGKSEYEDWDWKTQNKIVEHDYYNQFQTWWEIDENRNKLLKDKELVKLYTKHTGKVLPM